MKTFVINLKRAVERKKYMTNLLQHIDVFDYEFIDAVDGRNLLNTDVELFFDTKLSYARYGRELSLAEIACALSHHKCYSEIVNKDLEYALILEDDISIVGDVSIIKTIGSIIDTKKPLVFLLSGDYWFYNKKVINETFSKNTVFDAVGAYAYIINKAAARLLVEKNIQLSCVADHWAFYKSQGLKIQALFPYIIDANIENFESTIEQIKFGEIRNNMAISMKLSSYWLGFRKRILYSMGGYVAKQRKPPVKKKKIICINQAPLNPRSKRLSYVDTFLSLGADFEYWDMTRYFNQSPLQVDSQIASSPFVKKINNLQEVKQAFVRTDCENSCFFIGVPERWENRKFFKLLKDHHCRVLRSDPCANTIALKKTERDYLNFLLSPSKIIAFVKRKLLHWYFKHYDIHYSDVFSSSKLNVSTVKINHPDYDDFYRLAKLSDYEMPANRFAVFYDSYFPLHPDFKHIHKLKVEVDYQAYLKSMNAFFKKIEDKYELEVIIAAHPTALYNNEDFEGRKIIKWHTCELTQGAELIINQSSNSTSFAMLANKPIVFITSDEVEKCDYLSRYIAALSSLLGKEKYNIDHCEVDKMDIDIVEPKLRESYIYTYLTDATTEKLTNEDIYAAYVKEKMGL